MGIIISFITFILGFFAEKILDFLFVRVWKRIKRKKMEEEAEIFYKDSHKDVIITASSFPFFPTNLIEEGIFDKDKLLLAKPNEEIKDGKAGFSEEDCITDGFRKFITDNFKKDQLEIARKDVYRSFKEKKDANYDNKSIFGVSYLDGFSRTTDAREAPILTIKFFRTDYYTHRIIERLISDVSFDDRSSSPKFLNSNAWLRPSFGLSVILILPKENMIVLTKRSTNAAYTDGKEWLYVSATATLNELDCDQATGKPDLEMGVYRGIFNELGIEKRHLKRDTLRFYDAFYETHFHQDNIVVSIEASEDMTFSDLATRPGKDGFMQVKELIQIVNEKKAIAKYIKENKEIMRAQTVFSLESYINRIDFYKD